MSEQISDQRKADTFYRQIRDLSDRQARFVLYLVADGYMIGKAIDLVYLHFKREKKGQES